MIYIWEENEEFYSSLENKSDFINKALARERKRQEIPGNPLEHPDPRIRQIHQQIRDMENKSRRG